jgi:O6-methylguanine-DNA--protein-cysteine methyltransferase
VRIKREALALVEQLEQSSREATVRREEHQEAERFALPGSDAEASSHQALAEVARGEARAYEDAALRLRLLAAGIPVDT